MKVNLWGNLESVPGKALAEKLLLELEHQLTKDKIKELVDDGYLNPQMLDRSYKPSIQYLTEKYRRDEVYLPLVSQIVKQFYEYLY